MSTDELTNLRAYAGVVPLSLDMAVDYGLLPEAEARAHGWTPPRPARPGRLRTLYALYRRKGQHRV